MTLNLAGARAALVALAATLALWFGGMAALAFIVEPRAVVAFGSDGALYRAWGAADAPILAKGRGFIVVASAGPGTVRRLYAGGALFVWPIVARSCGGAI